MTRTEKLLTSHWLLAANIVLGESRGGKGCPPSKSSNFKCEGRAETDGIVASLSRKGAGEAIKSSSRLHVALQIKADLKKRVV